MSKKTEIITQVSYCFPAGQCVSYVDSDFHIFANLHAVVVELSSTPYTYHGFSGTEICN
jgi:hypothetical protein